MDSSPIITYNSISDNGEAGIYCTGDSRCRIGSNTITRNLFAGISIDGNAQPVIAGNLIEHNRDQGVHISDAHGGMLESNWIRGNNDAGVYLCRSALATKGNRVENNGNGGIVVERSVPEEEVAALVNDNAVYKNMVEDVRRQDMPIVLPAVATLGDE
jgi:parallel beta-helix repeat protein